MRATVSAALPALTVLTATIERLGQSCASAAGARVTRMAPAMAPHAKRNDIATSLECREVLIDFVLMLAWAAGRVARWRPAVRLHGSMMLPIGPRKQPAGAPCGRASHACGRVIDCVRHHALFRTG